MIQYAVKQGCFGLRNALICISEATLTVMVSRTSDLAAAEKHSLRLLRTGRSRLTVLMASHERKHKACRAES